MECLLADQAELARLAPSTRWVSGAQGGRRMWARGASRPGPGGEHDARSVHIRGAGPKSGRPSAAQSRVVLAPSRDVSTVLHGSAPAASGGVFGFRSSVVKHGLTCRSSGTTGFHRRWLGVSILFWVFHKAVTGTTVQPTSMGALPLMSMQVNGGQHYRGTACTIGGPTTAQPQS